MATVIEVRRPAELVRHGTIAGVVAGIALVAAERYSPRCCLAGAPVSWRMMQVHDLALTVRAH
jgi:hypothetical protein